MSNEAPIADVGVKEVGQVNPVHAVLVLCGIASAASLVRCSSATLEGLNIIDAVAIMLNGDSDVTEMAKRSSMSSRNSIAAGRVILVTIQNERIQALVCWVKDHQRRGKVFGPEKFTNVELNIALHMKEVDYNAEKIDMNLIDRSKCQTDHDWDNWQTNAYINKLSTTSGAVKIPVDYVVRADIDDDAYLFLKDDEELVYDMTLEGANFKHDNRLVYGMLKAACIKTDAWTWIQDQDRTTNGWKAWQALVAH